MLMLARPVWLHELEQVFGILLLLVVLAATLVALGKKAKQSA